MAINEKTAAFFETTDVHFEKSTSGNEMTSALFERTAPFYETTF